MANSCRSLDLLRNDRAKNITLFIPQVATGRRNFLVSRKTKIISQMARASHSGQIRGKKWIGLRSWFERRAAKRPRVRKSAGVILPATMHFSLRTRRATSWKSAAGKGRSLRNDAVSANGEGMSKPTHEPAILQEPR